MDLNDPTTLRSVSTLLQWFAIALIFLGGSFQLAKHLVDLRERRISSSLLVQKEGAQQKREEALRSELETSEKRIRSLDVQVSLRANIKWKDNLVPDPTRWIMLSGTRAAVVDFLLSDGTVISEEFHRAENMSLTAQKDGSTTVSYRSTAAPGSEIFSLLPDQLHAVKNIGFTCLFGQDLLSDTQVVFRALELTFFVNGRPLLVAHLDFNETVDYTESTRHAPWWTWPNQVLLNPYRTK